MTLKEPFPKNPEVLVKEVDATIKIKDIKEIYRLKDIVAIKWWETLLVLILFFSGTGFLFTVLQTDYLFPPDKSIILKFILVWFVILILTIIATIEFLLQKFRALRKLYELQTNLILSLQKEVDNIKNSQINNVDDNTDLKQ